MTCFRCRQRAFSMTELLAVVAIILILVSIIVVGMRSSYSRSLQLKCQQNLEQIGQAMKMYATANRGMLPKANSLTGNVWYETLALTYIENTEVLGCPVAGPPPAISGQSHYRPQEEVIENAHKVLYWLRDKQVKTGTKAGQIPFITNRYSRKHDNVSTAISLLAFLGMGCNDRYPAQFAKTVRMAVEYLSGPALSSDGKFDGCLNHYAEDSHIIGSQAVPIMALAAAHRSLEDGGLRQKARQAAQTGLGWLADRTAYHGGYMYNGPSDEDGHARMSTASWVYQAIGAARTAGFNVPSKLNTAAQYMLEINAQSNGIFSKRWDPTGAGTDTISNNDWTEAGLVMRMVLGDSAGSSVVQNQIDEIFPRHMNGFKNGGGRFHYYHTTRGLRLAGGPEWDAWLNPNSDYLQGWQGYPYYVLLHLQDAGADDEGNLMAYWSDLSLVDYGNYHKEVWVTEFSAMMLSDAFEESWLDPDYVPPAEKECSYGYNHFLGQTRLTVGNDTILVMDYHSWLINRGRPDDENADDDSMIATRHSDRANALMGDGSVRAFYVEDIREGMWTPGPGD